MGSKKLNSEGSNEEAVLMNKDTDYHMDNTEQALIPKTTVMLMISLGITKQDETKILDTMTC